VKRCSWLATLIVVAVNRRAVVRGVLADGVVGDVMKLPFGFRVVRERKTSPRTVEVTVAGDVRALAQAVKRELIRDASRGEALFRTRR
jgi:hypothetical protein